MNVIYKYPLIPLEINKLQIPYNSRILTVGLQGIDLFLWILVDTESVDVEKSFYIAGTGKELPESFHPNKLDGPKTDFVYVGTAVGNLFVWHVFQLQLAHH